MKRSKPKQKRSHRRRLPRSPKPPSTKALERQYYRDLKAIVDELKRLTKEFLLPNLDNILGVAQANRPTVDSARWDVYDDEIDRIISLMKARLLIKFPEEEIEALAIKTASKVEGFNAVQMERTFQEVLGTGYSRFEPWLTQEIKAFTTSNVKLIKSIGEKYFENVEGIVLRGAQSGTLSKHMAKQISHQFGVTERRGALIARDQVAKFNANLNQQRQRNAGLTKYEWSSSNDERVRSEHEERDGKVFEWAKPPLGGHPGTEVNCRCTALAVFEEE